MKRKQPTNWLPRDLMIAPYMALVLSQDEFDAALLELGSAERLTWLSSPYSNATVSYLEDAKKELCVIVALQVLPETEPIQIAGILTHEAVHVFQQYCSRIGEENPSSEFEAYSIQSIAQRLMQAYSERILAGTLPPLKAMQ